jgi:hypothetical protein
MTADPETPSIINRLLQATEDADGEALASRFSSPSRATGSPLSSSSPRWTEL